MLSELTIEHIARKFGKRLRYPSDCMNLSLTIREETGEYISVNTMKRLVGFIAEDREPRLNTLDIIAKYLGYENWTIYLESIEDVIFSQFHVFNGIKTKYLRINDQVEFNYAPDRKITIQYCGEFLFEVINAVNSKLLVGDKISTIQFIQNHPLLIDSVLRNEDDLGSLIVGKVGGITNLKKLT